MYKPAMNECHDFLKGKNSPTTLGASSCMCGNLNL